MTSMCRWKVSLFETGVSNYFEESPRVGRFVHLLYLHIFLKLLKIKMMLLKKNYKFSCEKGEHIYFTTFIKKPLDYINM